MSGGVNALPPVIDPDGRVLPNDYVARSQVALRRLRATCNIYFDGTNITSKLDPHLLMVRITDRQMGASVAEIEIDDSYGKIPNPQDGAGVYIELGWPGEQSYRRFEGMMEDVISAGQRKGGRTMNVTCLSTNMRGPGKQIISGSWGGGKDDDKGDEGTSFKDVANELADKMGITLRIAPRIGEIKRKFWEINKESPMSALERLSKELGGVFKPEGQNGGIADLQADTTAFGDKLPDIPCIVGENVIAWRMRPKMGRPSWGSMAHGFFDRDKAAWQVAQQAVQAGEGFAGLSAKHMGAFPAHGPEVGEQRAVGDGVFSVQQRGTGWVVIDGEPRAYSLGFASIHGARPGVDGKYRMIEVEHSYFRGGGFTSRLDLNAPDLFSPNSITGAWSGTP